MERESNLWRFDTQPNAPPLELHLDGVTCGGVRYGFFVRQNPWSKFDPEGLAERYGHDGYEVKGEDHHWSPVSTWKENRFSHDVQSELDTHTVGPDRTQPYDDHGWSRAHDTYNRVASERTQSYISKWKNKGGEDPSGLSASKAKEFATGLIKYLKGDKYIKEFGNMVSSGRGDKHSLNSMLDSWAKEGRIPDKHLSGTTRAIAQAARNSTAIKGRGITVVGGLILMGVAELSGANAEAAEELHENWKRYENARTSENWEAMMMWGPATVTNYGNLIGVPEYVQNIMLGEILPKK